MEIEAAEKRAKKARASLVRGIRDWPQNNPNKPTRAEMPRLVQANRDAILDLNALREATKFAALDDVMQRVQNPGIGELDMICTCMNTSGKRELPWAPELRRLFTLWQASGPNLRAMFDANPDLEEKTETDLRPLFVASETGRGYVHLGLKAGVALIDGEWRTRYPDGFASHARGLFFKITLNPFWDRLAGPCPRCKKYFVRRTAKRSIYCSRKCASQSTAAAATTKARQKQRAEKLQRAANAIAEWNRLKDKGRTNAGWKAWVSACDPEITSKFLTRAVNSDELIDPTKKR